MARKIYTLSDETFKVFSGFEASIARELECDVSYIYKIKNGAEQDRYPQFRAHFRAGCFAGAPVEHWLNELNGIFAKAHVGRGMSTEISVQLIEKINEEAKTLSTIVAAVEDGNLTKAECHAILAGLMKNDEINKRMQDKILHRLGEISEEEFMN